MNVDDTTMQEIVAFHGHMCPGLAIGVNDFSAHLRQFAASQVFSRFSGEGRPRACRRCANLQRVYGQQPFRDVHR